MARTRTCKLSFQVEYVVCQCVRVRPRVRLSIIAIVWRDGVENVICNDMV